MYLKLRVPQVCSDEKSLKFFRILTVSPGFLGPWAIAQNLTVKTLLSENIRKTELFIAIETPD
jgi:hypothetical protein